MEKPILVYFVILVGIRRYRVEYLKIEMDRSKDEEEAILEALHSYVALYEKIIRAHPSQWFNFYDFWEKR
jgi:predicted LPLAT superfamily acyltransferase